MRHFRKGGKLFYYTNNCTLQMITKSMLDKFAQKLTQMQIQSPPPPSQTIQQNPPTFPKIKPKVLHQPTPPQKTSQKSTISSTTQDNKQKSIPINTQNNLSNNHCIIIDDSDTQQYHIESPQHSIQQLNKYPQQNTIKYINIKQSINQSQQYKSISINQSFNNQQQYISNSNHIINNVDHLKNKKIKKFKKLIKKSTNSSSLIQQQCIKQNPSHQYSQQLNQSKQPFPPPQQPNPQTQQSNQQSINNSQQPLSKNTPTQQLYVYMMNNLLYLCGKLSPKLLKLYIKQLSQKHNHPFNKILTDFGIHQLISKFYQTHDIEGYFHQKYILSELEQLIPQLIFQIHLTNWLLLQKIVKGVFNWFRINQHYNDDWLVNSIKKKRKILKQYNVNYQLTLSMAKGTSIPSDYCQQPSADQALQLGYTTLKQYLQKNRISQLTSTQLQQTDDERLESTQNSIHIYQLKYYKKIKQKLYNLSQSIQSTTQNKQQNNHQYINNTNHQLIPLNIEIIKIGCKLPNTIQILSQFQSSQQQDTQKNNNNPSIKNVNKSNKNKQKCQNHKKKCKSKEILLTNKTNTAKIAKSVKKQTIQLHQQIPNNDNSSEIPHSNQPQKQIDITPSTEHRVRKTIQPLPKQKPKPLPNSSHQKQSTLKQSYKQWPNCQMIKSDELLKKLDEILYQFFLKEPQFTTKSITNQIQRILNQQLRVPKIYHQQIQLAWFRKYTVK